MCTLSGVHPMCTSYHNSCFPRSISLQLVSIKTAKIILFCARESNGIFGHSSAQTKPESGRSHFLLSDVVRNVKYVHYHVHLPVSTK